LIREVYEEAGLPLNSTPYIELHGTGTPVGVSTDPCL
jgi:acyl transferase domain-containing protein